MKEGEKMGKKNNDIEEQVLVDKILAHIRLFRMTTVQALSKMHPDYKRQALKSALRRLKDNGYIGISHLLIGNRRYYYLTRQCVTKHFGDPPKAGGPLGSLSLPENFGMLSFFPKHTNHQKLSRSEFQKLFAILCGFSGQQTRNYYLHKNSDGKKRLGYIYVDRGSADFRIVSKIRTKIITPRLNDSAWRTQIIDKKRFVISVITTTPVKAVAIEDALVGAIYSNIEINIHVNRELEVLLLRR